MEMTPPLQGEYPTARDTYREGGFFQILLLSTAAVGLLVLAGAPPAIALAEGVVLAMALTLSLGVGTALGHWFLLSTARCLDRGNALLAQLERLHDQLYGFDRVKVEQAVPWLKRVSWNLASGVFVGTVMLLYLFPCGVLLAVLRPPMGLPVGGWVPYALAGGGATLALLLSTHLLRCRHDLRVVANRVVEAEKLQGEVMSPSSASWTEMAEQTMRHRAWSMPSLPTFMKRGLHIPDSLVGPAMPGRNEPAV